MQASTRSSRELAPSLALLAVAAAICLSIPAGGAVLSTNPVDRRVVADTDEAVASFMACLNQAAKTLAGSTAAVVERDGDRFTLLAAPGIYLAPTDDAPVVAIRPHVFLLNLPPPATLS